MLPGCSLLFHTPGRICRHSLDDSDMMVAIAQKLVLSLIGFILFIISNLVVCGQSHPIALPYSEFTSLHYLGSTSTISGFAENRIRIASHILRGECFNSGCSDKDAIYVIMVFAIYFFINVIYPGTATYFFRPHPPVFLSVQA